MKSVDNLVVVEKFEFRKRVVRMGKFVAWSVHGNSPSRVSAGRALQGSTAVGMEQREAQTAVQRRISPGHAGRLRSPGTHVDHVVRSYGAALIALLVPCSPGAPPLRSTELISPNANDPVEFVANERDRFGPIRGIRVHRGPVKPSERTDWEGIGIATPLRMAMDLLLRQAPRELSRQRRLQIAVADLDQVLRAGLVDRDELAELLQASTRPRRRTGSASSGVGRPACGVTTRIRTSRPAHAPRHAASAAGRSLGEARLRRALRPRLTNTPGSPSSTTAATTLTRCSKCATGRGCPVFVEPGGGSSRSPLSSSTKIPKALFAKSARPSTPHGRSAGLQRCQLACAHGECT